MEQNSQERRRALVMRMARARMAEHLIAFMVGVEVDDLREEFGDEMKRAAIAAQLEVLETLLEMAKSGKHLGATVFWLKNYGVEQKAAATEKKSAEKTSKYCTVIPPPLKVRGPDGTLYEGPRQRTV